MSEPKKGRSLISKGGNDRIMTSDELAEEIVAHYNPFGCSVLDPCKGQGAFMRAFEKFGINADWCEIDEGRDFFTYDKKVDWIITNPPYSIFTAFLDKATDVADNIVFLSLANAWLFNSRLRIMKAKGFGFKERTFIDNPENFPKFGATFAYTHIQRGYTGKCKDNWNSTF